MLEVSDAQRIMAPDIALVRERHPGHNAQQCGLAGAIATDKANPFTRLYLKINLSEQRQMAISQRYTVETKERHSN